MDFSDRTVCSSTSPAVDSTPAERYGPRLSTVELEQFQVLGDDYEIGWHLKQLRSVASPTAHERRVQAITVKNRRLAYMNRLMEDGQYFSEDTMRLRSPLLHYECVGKYQDASARLEARPGERFSELLLRRAEEAVFQDRLKEEKRQAGIVEEEDRNVSEQEEDEEEEEVEEFDSDSEDEEDEQDLEEEEEDAAMVEEMEEPQRRQVVVEKANLQEQPQLVRRHGEVVSAAGCERASLCEKHKAFWLGVLNSCTQPPHAACLMFSGNGCFKRRKR